MYFLLLRSGVCLLSFLTSFELTVENLLYPSHIPMERLGWVGRDSLSLPDHMNARSRKFLMLSGQGLWICYHFLTSQAQRLPRALILKRLVLCWSGHISLLSLRDWLIGDVIEAVGLSVCTDL